MWAVADGVGGYDSGWLAARSVTACLEALPPTLERRPEHIRSALDELNVVLRQHAGHNGPGLIVASTVVVLLAQTSCFTCLWAGDSRLYLRRHGTLVQVTRDHSVMQESLDLGRLTSEKAGHSEIRALTRAVGAGTVLELDDADGCLLADDRFLLCSDGLSNALGASCIATLLDEARDQPADYLVAAALDRGATDNVTAVIIDVLA